MKNNNFVTLIHTTNNVSVFIFFCIFQMSIAVKFIEDVVVISSNPSYKSGN